MEAEIILSEGNRIPHDRQGVKDLPARGRMGEHLVSLLIELELTRIFRSTAGTLRGLPRDGRDPRGRDNNYYRIDLQQDPVDGVPLNIHYQVSRSTIAAVLVDRRVEQFGEKGLLKILEAFVLSFTSGCYPTHGLPNGGEPQKIYRVDVQQTKKDNKSRRSLPQEDGAAGKQVEQKKGGKAYQALYKEVLTKAGYHVMAKALQQALTKVALKLAEKDGAKSEVPLVGLPAGLGFAIERLAHRDVEQSYQRLSRASFTALEVGTAASIANDVGIVADDLLRDPEARQINEEMEHAKWNAAVFKVETCEALLELRRMGMTNDEIERELKSGYAHFEAVQNPRDAQCLMVHKDLDISA